MQDIDIKATFSAKLKRHRKFLKMTQNDLAFKVGMSLRHYQRVENGEKVPSVVIAYKIAKALGVSLDSLFD